MAWVLLAAAVALGVGGAVLAAYATALWYWLGWAAGLACLAAFFVKFVPREPASLPAPAEADPPDDDEGA